MNMNVPPDSKAVRKYQSGSHATKRAPGPTPAMSFKLKILIVAVLVGFGILHFIGGTRVHGASDKQSIDAMILMHAD
jgi:hypothetical protein